MGLESELPGQGEILQQVEMGQSVLSHHLNVDRNQRKFHNGLAQCIGEELADHDVHTPSPSGADTVAQMG